jgi:type IV pilus assembly protein PilO
MKPKISLPAFDFKKIAEEFQSLNPNDVGAWPVIPRVTVLFALFVGILVGGWFLFWSEQLETLDGRRQEETKLKDEFVNKKQQAINLDLYKQQLNEIDRSFGALLKQLPNKAEVEALLVEINQAGLGRGLSFELFRPGGEVVRDFYAELPVTVRLTGSYHDFGAFASDIGKLPRIVTLNNIVIAPPAGRDGTLVLDATVKTFRYLDEEELAKNKKRGGGKK